MFRKSIICMISVSFVLALAHIPAPSQVGKGYDEGKLKNCQKVWNDWFKDEHKIAKAELKTCLEGASTKEACKECKTIFKETLKDLRAQRKEGKKACNKCRKMANDNYKEARKQAKIGLKACLQGAADDKEARKACRKTYKEALKNARENLKEERKACLNIE